MNHVSRAVAGLVTHPIAVSCECACLGFSVRSTDRREAMRVLARHRFEAHGDEGPIISDDPTMPPGQGCSQGWKAKTGG